MIWNGRRIRVFAVPKPTDMRKGFDGLTAVVREGLDRDALSGDHFLFVAKNRIRAKILYCDGTGLVVYAKRLERGRFASFWDQSETGPIQLTAAELGLFLDGAIVVRRLSPPEFNLSEFSLDNRVAV